jgi:hypothetical protein
MSGSTNRENSITPFPPSGEIPRRPSTKFTFTSPVKADAQSLATALVTYHATNDNGAKGILALKARKNMVTSLLGSHHRQAIERKSEMASA